MGTFGVKKKEKNGEKIMTKVFIGNLSDDAKGHHVEDFFAKFGTLREITLKNGFGFVEFEDRRDAEDAVDELNGARLAGERVVVELAGKGKDRRSRSRSRDRGGRDSYWDDRSRDRPRGGGGGSGRPHRTQWAMAVDNLSSRC